MIHLVSGEINGGLFLDSKGKAFWRTTGACIFTGIGTSNLLWVVSDSTINETQPIELVQAWLVARTQKL
jgi:hypothetical protein